MVLKNGRREPQPFTIDESFAEGSDLPEKIDISERWNGMVGRGEDAGVHPMLAAYDAAAAKG